MNLFIDTSALVKLCHKESIDYFVVCDKNLVDVSRKYFHTFNPEIETIISNIKGVSESRKIKKGDLL